MNNSFRFPEAFRAAGWWLRLGCACLLAWSAGSPLARGGNTPIGNEPVITGIVAEGNDLAISVWVPAGKQRVTLECRPRIGPGSWVPESRQEINGLAGQVVFRLANRRELELLRVRAEGLQDLPLPAAFYAGRSKFTPTILTNSGVAIRGGEDGAVFSNSSPPPSVLTPGPGSFDSTRSVVESDIWRLDGSTLYFFNQGRGLQIIDVTDPDAPRVRGYLPVSASGEQMYLLPAVGPAGERFVALLLASGCSDGGEVLVVRVAANGQTEIVNELPFAGQLRESRLVGDALYLASYWWHTASTAPATGGAANSSIVFGSWQSDTIVTSFNLANPAASSLAPTTLTLALGSNPTAISATDEFLFVSTTGNAVWDNLGYVPGTNTVEIVDIRDTTGLMAWRGRATTRGSVADKFKLSLHDGVLRVASYVQPSGRTVWVTNWFEKATGRYAGTTGSNRHTDVLVPANPEAFRTELSSEWQSSPGQTWLETFSLADASSPSKLGELLLKENEQLYATRFAGDRAYLVTFRRIDPLFLVDLRNPAKPVVAGELEVPGFSTYLTPISDSRLLAMGLENGQPIVSLFDVTGLAHPKLISKVELRAKDGWGYSEANNDEKAFNYQADAGLILFPWQGWANGESFQTIQLVDLKNDVLTRRGVIDHSVAARRATVVGERVLSISAAELLTVSIANRDLPVVTSELSLQYRVDRVWVLGDRLLQQTAEPLADGTSRTILKLATQSEPERPLGSLSLPAGLDPIGLELRGSRLHVLQQSPLTYRTENQVATNTYQEWVPGPRIAVLRTNTETRWIPEQTIVSLVTNITTGWEPQPPWRPITGTNEQVLIVPQPQLPQIVTVGTNVDCTTPDSTDCKTNLVTEVVWLELPPLRLVKVTYEYGPEVPQPDLWVTNFVVEKLVEIKPAEVVFDRIWVSTNWVESDPVLVTRTNVFTNSVAIPVPGYLLASVVDCSGVAPRLLGQTRSDVVVQFQQTRLAGLWPTPDQLVWTDAVASGTDYGIYPVWARGGGPVLIDAIGPAISLPGGVVSDRRFVSDIWWGGGWGGWWGNRVVNFLPVAVSDPAAPQIGALIRAGDKQEWTGVSGAFASEGRIFFSRETRTVLPTEPATNAADLVRDWQQRWAVAHRLEVLDLTDPVEPRFRAALDLPGQLTGLSHAGALLYTRGGTMNQGGMTDDLQALAYDGLEVRLVDSLPVNGAPQVLRPDGVVVMAVEGTTNRPPSLASWALGSDAHWQRYTEVTLNGRSVVGLHAYPDGLVVAERGAGEFLFLKSGAPEQLLSLGASSGHCGLFPDWIASDASLEAGLWIPRGSYGLWSVGPDAVPVQP